MPLEPGAQLDGLDKAKIFAAPDDPADWPAWREALKRWRAEAAARIEYDDSAYRAPELAWTHGCFSVALVWLWDELLYDHAAARFTPARFCEESEREFGGFDGIVLWHAYPVIGIDERNQFDFYRDVPGIRELVRDAPGAGPARLRRTTTPGTSARAANRSRTTSRSRSWSGTWAWTASSSTR